MLKLTKPLVFLDIESTGIDKKTDRIIDLAMIKITPEGLRDERTWRFNPNIPIPSKATEIHGITNEQVASCPTFSSNAQSILSFMQGCDLCGFNSNMFDIPLLYNEFSRAGLFWDHSECNFIDAGNIFKICAPRTLEAAVEVYLGRKHEGAHGALADVGATIEVLVAQIKKHPELPQTATELDLFCNYGNRRLDLNGYFTRSGEGAILLNFGKYKGELARDHIDFLHWLIGKDFPDDTIAVAESVIQESSIGDNIDY